MGLFNLSKRYKYLSKIVEIRRKKTKKLFEKIM
jgi:hypothetical protein